MSDKHSISSARKNLPRLVSRAEAGSAVELTRRGKPVAVLVSVDEYRRLMGERVAFADAYAAFVEKVDLAEVGLQPEEMAQLRDRSSGREAPFG